MCVIAVKNKGVALPNTTAIKDMWDTNSDGAGYMYTRDERVYISKGYMDIQEFEKSLETLKNDLAAAGTDIKDIPMVFHFRIGTHGSRNEANTHPFPISAKEKHLKALDVKCDLAMVHNGIISGFAPSGDMSDTMQYIIDFLTPLAQLNKAFYKTQAGQTILENTIGSSKLAFLDKHGDVTLIGQFKNGTKNDTQGMLFSNLNHEYVGNYSCDYVYPRYKSSVITKLVKRIPKGYYVANSTALNAPKIAVTEYFKMYVDDFGILYMSTDSVNYYQSTFYKVLYKDKNSTIPLTAQDIDDIYYEGDLTVYSHANAYDDDEA